MIVGYARVSMPEQSLDLQNDALRQAGYEKIHIPSDLVVDQWVSNVESSSPRDVL
jgi:DNA invertase Pin-like site-specific DNA recombinase